MTRSRSRIHRLIVLSVLTAAVLVGPTPASAQPAFEVMYSFTKACSASSSRCYSALIHGTDGHFYGTTRDGGAADLGMVYRMTVSGSVTILHDFAGGSADGATPFAALLQAKDGNFYGTTSAGGVSNLGTVFRMTPDGSVTILHAFAGGTTDGSKPQAALIQAIDGNFYGTTNIGGSLNVGTVFRMTPSGATTLLHSFTGTQSFCSNLIPCPPPGTDGSQPSAALMQAVDGDFYGTTTEGGGTTPSGTLLLSLNGTVFRMTPAGVVTTLGTHVSVATGCCIGAFPVGPLVQGSDGNLYGALAGCCSSNYGFFFGVNPGSSTFLPFTSLGATPISTFIQATDGNFYGMTYSNFFSHGVDKITPARVVSGLPSDDGKDQGGSAFLQAADGALYGILNGNSLFSLKPRIVRLNLGLPAPAAPAMTTQPSNQTVRAGRKAVFVAAASGLPVPPYQWQVSRDTGSTWTNVTDGGPYSGARTSQLSVTPPTQGFDRYQFRAAAANPAGRATSNAAVLRVQAKPAVDVDGDGKTDLVVFRPQSGTWFYRTSQISASTPFGQSGDVQVPGDYDGDGVADLAVWRPATGVWFILTSSSAYTAQLLYQWGLSTDLPVPGDYDGDGKTDLAVYRPSTAIWHIAQSSTSYKSGTTRALGVSTDIPVPADYDGDGTTDIAVYRPSTGAWTIRNSGSETALTVRWGIAGDMPVPGDYDGDRRADLAVWRSSNGVWFVKQSTTNFATDVSYQWGQSGDIPIPADYDSDDVTDLAVYRPASGTWWIETSTTNYTTSTTAQFGQDGDLPAQNAQVAYAVLATIGRPTVSTLANLLRSGDMDGDGRVDLTVWRPSSGMWFTAQSSAEYTTSMTVQWGTSSDIPTQHDYDGDGKTDVAVYRPSTGVWYMVQSSTALTTSTSVQWGLAGDVPVPGDYDGDGKTDVAVYRPSNGVWYMKRSTTNFTTAVAYQWGSSDDRTVPGDYDGDGLTDVAVYRPSTGVWYILKSANGYTTSVTYQFGQSGDITVPGDFDGDGKTDVAVYRPSSGVWYVLKSGTGFTTSSAFLFGLNADVPAPGDFDGDGSTDIAVWRPSTGEWHVLHSSTGLTTSSTVQWGSTGDIPILRRQ